MGSLTFVEPRFLLPLWALGLPGRRHAAGRVAIDLWYDDTTAGRRKQLLTFTLPTWPLVAETGGAFLILLGLTDCYQTYASKDERLQD